MGAGAPDGGWYISRRHGTSISITVNAHAKVGPDGLQDGLVTEAARGNLNTRSSFFFAYIYIFFKSVSVLGGFPPAPAS